ncbi:MAG: hypothetical protein IKD83_06095, partial [Firmicutes bacterium]|nr:hypothetical protein [Bacillota bacterium]
VYNAHNLSKEAFDLTTKAKELIAESQLQLEYIVEDIERQTKNREEFTENKSILKEALEEFRIKDDPDKNNP